MSIKPGTPLESTIVKYILAALNKIHGCRALKYHGSQFAQSGHPDVYGCYGGMPFFIEVKRPGGPGPKPSQVVELAKWDAVGAATGVARSVHDALEIIYKGKEAQRETLAATD